MARFRPFGRRQDGPAAHEPDPWLDDPPRGGRDLGPRVELRSVDDARFGDRAFDDRAFDDRDFDDRGRDERDLDDARLDDRDRRGPGPVTGVPATRAAAPALWAPRRAGPDPVELDDAPVTDPFGFPPVPPVVGTDDEPHVRRAPAWAAWVPDRPSPSVPFPTEPDEPADGPTRQAGGPVHARSWVADGSSGSGGDSAATSGPVAPVPDARPSAAEPSTAEPSTAGPSPAAPRPGVPAFASTGPAPQATASAPLSPTAAGRSGGPTAPDPAATGQADAAAGPHPSTTLSRSPDPAEAAALAGAFAADYLSWDEDDPARRGRALADHLPGPDPGHALLGWSGAGRQRAEIVLPGAVRPDGDGRLLVDVRVRVTPYRRVSRSEATPEPDPGDALGTPAAAPPVTARGWRGLAARWVRLGVAVVRDGERLVVDAGEETTDDPDGEPGPAPARPVRTPEDPTIDGDDVVAPNGSRR